MSGCGGACGCGGTCGGGSSGKAAKEGKKGEAAEAKPKCRCVCWCEDVPLATHLLVPADSVASRDSVVGGGIPAAPSLPVPTLTLVRERRPGFDEVVPRQRAVAADSPWTPTGYEEVLTWTGEPDPGPATDASVPGPGIHRSYSPADVLASRVSRTRHPTGSPAAGLGTADGASPSPFPVLLPGLPEARPYPVLSAAAPGAGRWDYRTLRPGGPASPVLPLRAPGVNGLLMGQSSAALAALPPEAEAGIRAGLATGALAPPDAVYHSMIQPPAPPPLAPPHAGSFRLGGPDMGPGAGVGAPRSPVAGSDGHPRWRPDMDHARRAEDSDVDAFRPAAPLRMPFGSREGDGMAGAARRRSAPRKPGDRAGSLRPPQHLPPIEEPPPLREALPESGVPAAFGSGVRTFVGMPGKSPAEVSPPQAVPAWNRGLGETASLRPPAGPWALEDAFKAPPAFEGAPAEVPPEQPQGAPLAGPLDPSGRPVQAGIEAMKTAMRGAVPVDAWRPPKPSAPTGPYGSKGGKGLNIGSLAGMIGDPWGVASTALAALDEAKGRLKDLANKASSSGGMPSAEVMSDLTAAARAVERAKVALAQAEAGVAEATALGGTDAMDRIAEERLRQKSLEIHAFEKELKKFDTKPNFGTWLAGDSAMEGAMSVRDGANDILNGSAYRGEDVPPDNVAAAEKLSKEAKQLAKEAKKAGKAAKNASKYGTKKEAEAAEKKAAAAEKLAKDKLDEAQKALHPPPGGLNTSALLAGGDLPPFFGLLASMGLGPDVNKACGDPHPGCDHVDLDCMSWEKRVCVYGVVTEAGSGKGKGGGSKGKGRGGGQGSGDARTPGDTQGSTQDSPGSRSVGEEGHPATGEGTMVPGSEGIPPSAEVPGDAQATTADGATLAGGTTDEEIAWAARRALEEMAGLKARYEREMRTIEGAASSILLKHPSRRSKGEEKALAKLEEEFRVLDAARESLGLLAGIVLGATKEAVTSKGAEREDAFDLLRAAHQHGVAGVRAFEKDAKEAIKEGWRPVTDPDRALQALRQDVEDELARRMTRAGEGADEKAIRAEILLEREQGEAEGDWSRWTRVWSQASEEALAKGLRGTARAGEAGILAVGAVLGTVGQVVDSVLGRPVRWGILAARDALHGTTKTESAWARSKEFGTLTAELLEGMEEKPALQRYAVFLAGMAAETFGDVSTLAAGAKLVGVAARAAKSGLAVASGRAGISGRVLSTGAVEAGEATAGGVGGWTRLSRGVRLRRVGNYWIKEVDPEASRLAQWYGRGSIEAQAKGLERLGDMAPDFLYRGGRLVTRHAGEFEGGAADFLRTWARGSWRLRTPFNDIRLRNIGQGGIIFDPALHPIEEALVTGAVVGGGAKVTYDVVKYVSEGN